MRYCSARQTTPRKMSSRVETTAKCSQQFECIKIGSRREFSESLRTFRLRSQLENSILLHTATLSPMRQGTTLRAYGAIPANCCVSPRIMSLSDIPSMSSWGHLVLKRGVAWRGVAGSSPAPLCLRVRYSQHGLRSSKQDKVARLKQDGAEPSRFEIYIHIRPPPLFLFFLSDDNKTHDVNSARFNNMRKAKTGNSDA